MEDKFYVNETTYDQLYRPKDLKFSRGLMIPKRGLIYDHVYIRRQYGSWYQWSSLLSNIDIDDQTKVSKHGLSNVLYFRMDPALIF
jgi:hypothetical protein